MRQLRNSKGFYCLQYLCDTAAKVGFSPTFVDFRTMFAMILIQFLDVFLKYFWISCMPGLWYLELSSGSSVLQFF